MKLKENKGITLIALIITIVIMLILAIVTIAAVKGEGIIGKAKQAKADYQNAQSEEQGILDRYLAEMEGLVENNTSIGENTLPEVENPENNGNSEEPPEEDKEIILKTEAYVGYYADVDADGTVDGVIYADLAIGNTGDGQWYNSDGNYTINKIENVKDYYISQTNYSESFGTKDVLCATGEGNERFYVMALTDFNSGTSYSWYDSAYGNNSWYDSSYDDNSGYTTITSVNFGTGKQNTLNMIEKWDNKAYGEQDDNETYKDIWGQIQSEVAEGWFVPSRGEWSAFLEELGITGENYNSKNLSGQYWSSSKFNNNTYDAWSPNPYTKSMNRMSLHTGYSIRLNTTF